MQKPNVPFLPLLSLLLLAMFVAGCDFVGDVLEFGFWTGVILLGVLLLVIWGVVRMIKG